MVRVMDKQKLMDGCNAVLHKTTLRNYYGMYWAWTNVSTSQILVRLGCANSMICFREEQKQGSQVMNEGNSQNPPPHSCDPVNRGAGGGGWTGLS